MITNVWSALIFALGINADKLKWNAGFGAATLAVVVFILFVNRWVIKYLDCPLMSIQIVSKSHAFFWISCCESGGHDSSSHSN